MSLLRTLRYRWRNVYRTVYITQNSQITNRILKGYLSNPQKPIHTVGFDIEYHRNTQIPAVVTIALNSEVALYHRQIDSLSSHRYSSLSRQTKNTTLLPKQLVRVLSNPLITKVGVAIEDDIRKLSSTTSFLQQNGWPRGIFDLQTFYRLCVQTKHTISLEDFMARICPFPHFKKISHE